MGALSNIKILDITHVLAGPFCTYQLALLGADVIKVEPPDAPDCARGRGPDPKANDKGLGLNYQVQGGNKRAIAIDLADREGREILLALAKDVDVVVENYATDTLARLGLGYEILSDINPSLIHCSISGYGDEGPDAHKGAYDNIIQAGSGTIAQCDGHKPVVSFIDYSTGYSAAFAISSALLQRSQTGLGCHISVSMLEVAMQMMSPEVAAVQHPVSVKRNKEPGIMIYDTSDGQLMLGAFRPQQYRKLADVLATLDVALDDVMLKLPELNNIHDWPDVWAISNETRNSLSAIFLTLTTANWMEILHDADLPCEPVKTLSEAVDNPQLAARGYFQTNPEDTCATLPLTAFRMSIGGPILSKAPPKHGQHTLDVLQELGLDTSKIKALMEKGIIS